MTRGGRDASPFLRYAPPTPQEAGWRIATQAAAYLGISVGRVRQLLIQGDKEPGNPWSLHGVKLAPGPKDPWVVHVDELQRFRDLAR